MPKCYRMVYGKLCSQDPSLMPAYTKLLVLYGNIHSMVQEGKSCRLLLRKVLHEATTQLANQARHIEQTAKINYDISSCRLCDILKGNIDNLFLTGISYDVPKKGLLKKRTLWPRSMDAPAPAGMQDIVESIRLELRRTVDFVDCIKFVIANNKAYEEMVLKEAAMQFAHLMKVVVMCADLLATEDAQHKCLLAMHREINRLFDQSLPLFIGKFRKRQKLKYVSTFQAGSTPEMKAALPAVASKTPQEETLTIHLQNSTHIHALAKTRSKGPLSAEQIPNNFLYLLANESMENRADLVSKIVQDANKALLDINSCSSFSELEEKLLGWAVCLAQDPRYSFVQRDWTISFLAALYFGESGIYSLALKWPAYSQFCRHKDTIRLVERLFEGIAIDLHDHFSYLGLLEKSRSEELVIQYSQYPYNFTAMLPFKSFYPSFLLKSICSEATAILPYKQQLNVEHRQSHIMCSFTNHAYEAMICTPTHSFIL